MRPTPIALVAPLLVALAATSLSAAAPAPSMPAGQIAVEASFEKGSDRPDQILCKVSVKDLATGTVLAAPQLAIMAGENATTTSTAEGYDVEISVFVTKGGGQVDLAVILRRDGVKTAAQAMTVKLPL